MTQSGHARAALLQCRTLTCYTRSVILALVGKAHEAARFHLPSGEEISKMLDHDRQEAKSFGPRAAHRDSGIGDDAHRVAQPGCQRESARRRLAWLPAATARSEEHTSE